MLFQKAKSLYVHIARRFASKRAKLSSLQQEKILRSLNSLKEAIQLKNREAVREHMRDARMLFAIYLQHSWLRRSCDFVIGLGLALVTAILVRQVWFEPYEIPTGSMRPTLKEQDRLLVSKTTLGLNIPLKPGHLYFDDHLMRRNGIVTLTSAGLDIADSDTMYFYIFPGKKQFVKRLIGKPGDTLYFYGGKVFGIDRNGQEIEQEPPELARIDHIPFLRFEGQLSYPVASVGGFSSQAIIHQWGVPVAFLDMMQGGHLLSLTEISGPGSGAIEEYGQLWGMDNFAMARLSLPQEAEQAGASPIEDALLYLQLSYHPTFRPMTIVHDPNGKIRPGLHTQRSFLPLFVEDIDQLFDTLYTARFRVKQGLVTRSPLEAESALPNSLVPALPDVPDGVYEFYYGKAYEVVWQGIVKELPSGHPLYKRSPERLQFWFNLGIDFNKCYQPSYGLDLWPNRYAYFRDGDLYVMGGLLWKQGDPKISSAAPFVDSGPPSRETIIRYGLKVPEESCLVLGDNHAMSGDSRLFGFVPEENLRGAPSFVVWPYGERWGRPNQPPYPWLTLPNIVMWSLLLLALIIWRIFRVLLWKRALRMIRGLEL